MKVLLAYSSKTKNTKKVALSIYEGIKNLADVTLFDIKKGKNKLDEDFDLYILGSWTDKTNANKLMQRFIDLQGIKNKNTAIFLTCGVPREHYHATDSINNFISFMEERENKVLTHFVCQGKIDPKIIIVFKILTLRDPNFIHKMTPDLKDMVRESKTHPDEKDLQDAREHFVNFLLSYFK